MATHLERQRLEKILLGQHQVLEEVYDLLEQEQKHDDVIRAVVLGSRKATPIRIPHPDPDRVYHVDTIRELCITYRLRFLEAGLFKGPIPPQAVHTIRVLEKRTGAPMQGFHIMAPGDRFKLCDSEVDPLLFVPLGDELYYLVHKWGNDLSRWRMIKGFPVRTPAHLAAAVLVLAVILTWSVPEQWLMAWQVNRFLMLVWNTLVLTSFTVFGWFAFFGQFSVHNWNSRYFN